MSENQGPGCWLGDIIEFYDCPFNGEISEKQTHVDRVLSIHRITTKDLVLRYEIWTELYNEVNGRLHVLPEALFRIVEKSNDMLRTYPPPEVSFADRVVFTEDGKSYISRISEIDQRVCRDEYDYCEYQMESPNYSLTMDEFDEVIKADPKGKDDGPVK